MTLRSRLGRLERTAPRPVSPWRVSREMRRALQKCYGDREADPFDRPMMTWPEVEAIVSKVYRVEWETMA